jgi:hypothetical protein
METIGALEDQCGDRHLDVGHHRQPLNWPQGVFGSRPMLAGAGGRLTPPPPRHSCTSQRTRSSGTSKDNVHGIPKGRTLERRHWAPPKSNNDTRVWHLNWELHLESKETFYEALGQIIRLEIKMRAFKISIRLRKMSANISWRSQSPPKRMNRLRTQCCCVNYKDLTSVTDIRFEYCGVRKQIQIEKHTMKANLIMSPHNY